MSKVTVAPHAGFCFGVARAVGLAQKQAKQYGTCYTLGPIIHNRAVVESLAAEGVICVDSLQEVPSGGRVFIRAHGETPQVYQEMETLGLCCCDATCPDVQKIHRIVSEQSQNGHIVFIFGDKKHPEVIGIAGWCQHSYIFSDEETLQKLWIDNGFQADTPVSIVSQTTAQRPLYEKCVNFLKKVCTNLKIFDTICNATVLRQQEAAELAAQSDVMIVVGDSLSANTRHLVEICARVCPRTYLVEDAAGASRLLLPTNARVGLTAGASAPARVIKEVEITMSELVKKSGEMEESFAEMLEQSFKTLTTGDKVSGLVTAVTPTEIHVDLGTKHAGYIPVAELSDDPSYVVADHIRVGETIETFVMRVNDVEGTALLSKKRVDAVQSWEDIEVAREAHNMVEGIVTEENKGGLVVSVRGVRVFVPASQTGIPKDSPLSVLLKKRVKLYVTEVNRARRRVVGSIRAAQADDRKLKSDVVWGSIEVGKRYQGVVKSLTAYGAFVDIGGVDGMVHVSELSWKRVSHPSDLVKVGDPLEVYVLSFDTEKKKISLGHKNKDENPWQKFIDTHTVGDVVKVRVVKLAAFGAFCEIIPGVDGLIHISHISDQRINKPSDALYEGQAVDVKILEIDQEHKKISLSIRALTSYEEAPSTEEKND